MALFLVLPFLFGNFIQKWYFPQGVSGFGNTIVQIADIDRDEHMEFAFTTYGSWPPYIYVYELQLPSTWHVDSIPLVGPDLLWDSGDFDLDGLYDFVIQSSWGPPAVGIAIFESSDSFSYPTEEVWRDTVGLPVVMPICVHDIDQDGFPEIVKMGGDAGASHYIDFLIYEAVEDNTYAVTCSIATETSPTSTVGFGDFDQDAGIDFVMGTIDGKYSVFESTGDDTYEPRILNQQLPTANIKDCVSVPDADGDGKLEFVVKGYVIPSAEIHAFIFEATGDNTYEIIKTFTLWGGDYYGGYSDVGDVDGDSISEIALEGLQTVHIIKAAGNDSFYVWETLPGNIGGSCVRVYDVDGNGLSEVIISGNNETRIYEYQVGIEEDKKLPNQLSTFEVHPNPFANVLDIRFNPQFAGEITVNVYDVSGRLIRSIYCGSTEGCNPLTWSGDDNNGRRVPQGIYFIRIENLDLQQTFCEKVIKMR